MKMSLEKLAGLMLILLIGGRLSAQTASDWPQFRGPSGQGISTDKNVPLKWGPKENIAWKVDLPGAGASSPIVFGSRIYVTAFTGKGDSIELHLLALNRADGKPAWTKKIAANVPEQPINQMRENHGYASSTPFADASGIYCFFGKTGVIAFDHDGKQLWRTSVGQTVHGFGSGASPVVYDNLVVVNAGVESTAIIALDKTTGKEVWRAPGNRECAWNTPILVTLKSGKTELVLAVGGKVVGLDPKSGKQAWSTRTDIPWYMVPRLVSDNDVVYVLGGRTGASLAVRAGGTGEVTKSHRLWTSLKGSNVTSPIFHEGHLYWMNDVSGIAYCADAATGKTVYEERATNGMGVYASPVLAEGRLYYVARNGRTYVLAASPRYEVLATNDLGERTMFNSSPAIAGSKIYLRTDKYLYCIGTK